jgi:histidinol dehydrogenase
MRIVDFSAGLDLPKVDALLAVDDVEQTVETAVRGILNDVRERGDAAVADYTKRFDEFDLKPELMRVPASDIDKYAASASDELIQILHRAAKNVRDFHEQQLEESWEYYAGDGVRLGVRYSPIGSVGIYIPGGKAAYPSSVLMNAVPAQVAGVERIVAVTPPRSLEENPLVAAALKHLGINEVYRIGGAQSIAALAYGTATIPRVQKIVGPGNAYVQSAKRQVYGTVDIDMVAGPSEVAIVADETCDPAWIAADLLAQAT